MIIVVDWLVSWTALWFTCSMILFIAYVRDGRLVSVVIAGRIVLSITAVRIAIVVYSGQSCHGVVAILL